MKFKSACQFYKLTITRFNISNVSLLFSNRDMLATPDQMTCTNCNNLFTDARKIENIRKYKIVTYKIKRPIKNRYPVFLYLLV